MAKYTVEKSISISSIILTILLLILLIRKEKIRQALIPFLFHQVLTWFFGLIVVEKGLIRYPVRYFFSRSTKSSFIFEYLIFPAFAVFFNLFYPAKPSLLMKNIHYLFFTLIITFFETIAVKYTKLIEYKKWTWYWSFITIWISYYITNLFYRWYFKQEQRIDKDHFLIDNSSTKQL